MLESGFGRAGRVKVLVSAESCKRGFGRSTALRGEAPWGGLGLVKAQVSMEFVLVLAVLLGFVVTIALISLRESELNVALASARLASREYGTRNPSFYVSSVDYAVGGRSVNLTPSLFGYGQSAKLPLPQDFKELVLIRLRDSVSPSSPAVFPNDCFSSSNYDYCVV